jgi:hypothetical protein
MVCSSSEPPSGFWGPNRFEAQSTKQPASSVFHTRPPQLDACHHHPWSPDHQVFQSLHSTCMSAVLTRSTRSLPCTLALVDVPRCQPPWLVTRPTSPLIQPSRLSFIAPGPLARHVPTCPSFHRRPPPPSSTPAHHKPRDMLHNLIHAMVSS